MVHDHHVHVCGAGKAHERPGRPHLGGVHEHDPGAGVLHKLSLGGCGLLKLGEEAKVGLKGVRPEEDLVDVDVCQRVGEHGPVEVTVLPPQRAARAHGGRVEEVLLHVLKAVVVVGDDRDLPQVLEAMEKLQRRASGPNQDGVAVAHHGCGVEADRVLGGGVLADALGDAGNHEAAHGHGAAVRPLELALLLQVAEVGPRGHRRHPAALAYLLHRDRGALRERVEDVLVPLGCDHACLSCRAHRASSFQSGPAAPAGKCVAKGTSRTSHRETIRLVLVAFRG